MPNWTKEQQLAIDESGKNIIVSAGAGSGKTAVLSERVLKKVLNGMDIDRMLILTFTKAAATEMADRIRKKIKKNNLTTQLNKLDSSYITTFDSYSLSLVKKYHYLLNVKQDVNIIETNVLNIKIKEYLDAIMEEEYSEKKDDFVKLINDFCIKDDQIIKDSILSLNDKLNMKYNKKEYLDNYLEIYYNEDFINDKIQQYLKIIQEKVHEFDKMLYHLADYVDTDYFSKLMNLCQELVNSKEYLEIKHNANNITRFPNLPKGSDEDTKKIKDNLKSILDEIKVLTSLDNVEQIRNSIMLTKPYVSTIIRIINKLDDKINNYKYQNDLYDFVDISKMAIKIVLENDNIREEIKNYFQEILVDEYQDTSDLQEIFLSLISNNNLYMVGDVKQSIYRFRNANPNIFRYKYNNYAKNNGGMKIDLLKNFRSREEVLQNINLIFDLIMDEEIGGADYIKEHEMHFGNTSYNIEGKTEQNNNFEIYNYTFDKELGFTKDEIEAFIIADDILDKVNNHYQVFDKDNLVLRDITFDDFSILIDRSTTFELYKKIFLYKQIPLSIYKDEYLTNSNLFLVFKNIFYLLYLYNNHGTKKEIAYTFLSIGRSFLFDFDDEYLFDIIQLDNYDETLVFKIIKKISENIEEKTITIILDEIIEYFNVYERLRYISSIKENEIKINYLYTLGENLNSMGYNYTEFKDFLNNIFDNDTNISFPINKEDGNSVKIMTIHKSKGLEYHICYFPGLTKKFNDSDLKNKVIFSNELGIITPYYDDGIAHTIYQELFKKQFQNDEISEKIRLFYVALTRAKEKMIFVLPMNDTNEEYQENIVDKSIRRKYKSFSDILESIRSKIKVYEKDIDLKKVSLNKQYNLINSNNIFSNLEKKQEIITVDNYPKLSMKELKASHFSKGEIRSITKEEKEIMDFGTKMHYYMESLDLKNPDYTGIEEEYVPKIKKFMQSDLMKNIHEANIFQEYEFITKNEEEKHGFIDLMLEYHNHIDIIDYKLKNIMDEAYFLQLSGYRDYIKSITNKPVDIYLYSLIDGIYRKL